ncbi:choice-of-anchor D domain-containing protein [Hyalangium rubrum]|uniref:Choice-of-anchor D domain-containing protein n=1 Tax=Hyalangium rubrum TaxID=3103134 RepID=A0ABU5GX43_9BACT|nr:choice-of-anchor D domain-containing protein [Hyalangium sp. s54d21]MDY7225269.1 choice-of-anchor D domain-containing protein [Hyalangium sp. s54d21]
MRGWRWVWLAAWACWAAAVGGCDRPSSYGKGARASFAARPQALEFGPAAVGSTKTVKLRLANEGRASMRVESAVSSVPNVEVPPFEPFTLNAGGEHELEVRFTPDVEGTIQGMVLIQTDADDEGNTGAQVAVAGLGVKAWVEVKSQGLDFGNVSLDTVEVRELKVRNPTSVDSPLRLAVAGADADQFSSSEAAQALTLRAGEERTLSVAFKPGRLGAASAAVHVEVCPDCEPAVVPLVGTGIASQLEISPLRVDFGRVAVAATAEQSVMVRNQGTEPIHYTGAQILSDPTGVFRVVSAPAPAGNVLRPGDAAEVRVAFTPTALGRVPEGRVQIQVQTVGSTAPGPKVALVGEGGSSCISVQPRAIDFGEVAEGMSATRKVEIFNRCREQVMVSNLQIDTQRGGFFTLAQAPASTPIGPNQATSVGVTFTPRPGAGQGAARLAVTVRQGGSTATEAVTLAGKGRVFQPCQYALSPQNVDFGSVPVGAEVALAVSLRNTGTHECYLAGLQLAAGSDAAFTAAPVENRVLAPGGRANLLVRFKPLSDGSFGGLAEGWVNHPSAGHPTVALQGAGVQSCFSVQPTHLEFGLTKLTCEPRTRELVAYNHCSTPVTVSNLAVEQQTEEFVLSNAPAFPVTIASGQQLRLRSTYVPADDGEDAAALRFLLEDGSMYTASMVGRGATLAEQTDDFMQEPEAKVDVLFVVDNSGSMMEEQQSLGANFAAFMSAAQIAGVDYRIGVTTTGLDSSPGGWSNCPGGAEGGENGRLFPVDNSSPRVITRQTPNAAGVFANNTQVGVCHWNEQGLEAAYRALSAPLLHGVDDPRTPQVDDGNGDFLRSDARLAIIFVTDEEDFSTQDVSFYETYFRALKDNDPSKLSISAIAGPEDLATCSTASSAGTRYIELARATGGVVESICTPNWAESLEKLSSTTFGPKRSFPLSEVPADTTQIVVTVDGVQVTQGWTYDASTNSILFDVGAAPPPGAYIEVTYPLGC